MGNKRNTKFSQKTELEDMNDYLCSENQFLKKKNEDLAKVLSETKLEYQKLWQNNLEMHKKLYSNDVERIKYKEFVRSLSLDMEIYIKQFISLTEQMTNMLDKANTVIKSSDALDQFINVSKSLQNLSPESNQNKTMAVMPMVSGHTILSPKINLPRVSVRQLTDMMHRSNNADGDSIEADEIEFADNVIIDNEDDLEDSSEIRNDQLIRRLDTMQEEDEEEEEEGGRSQQALLSGIFRDVKVYISPLTSQHVIQFKSGSSSRKFSKDFNQSNNISRRSSKNCSDETLTPKRKNISRKRTLTPKSDQSSNTRDSASENSLEPRSTKKNHKDMENLSIVTRDLPEANSEEYNPLEGPSSLWNNTPDVQSFIRAPNETSTPLSSAVNSQPCSLCPYEKKTPKRRSIHITKRKSVSKRSTVSSKISHCSVKLQKISASTLKSYVSGNSSTSSSDEISHNDRNDSPTILERSRRSSIKLTSAKGKKRTSAELSLEISPKFGRAKRNVKQVTYKEPSLIKKLRR